MFPRLAEYGAHIRRGQLTLVAAGSGVGKSSLITFVALSMESEGLDKIPTLYFSADSDIGTFGIRTGSMVLNKSTRRIEDLIEARDVDTLSAIEEATSHMWISFDSSPSPMDISDEVDMFAMVYGDYPSLIVVDNLMDVQTGGMEERGGQDAVLDYLKQLARRCSAAVVVLCHVTGEWANGDLPIPLNGLMNKIDKRPRLVLTLHTAEVNVLGVSIVKNSNGQAAADASLTVHIPWTKENMWFGVK